MRYDMRNLSRTVELRERGTLVGEYVRQIPFVAINTDESVSYYRLTEVCWPKPSRFLHIRLQECDPDGTNPAACLYCNIPTSPETARPLPETGRDGGNDEDEDEDEGNGEGEGVPTEEGPARPFCRVCRQFRLLEDMLQPGLCRLCDRAVAPGDPTVPPEEEDEEEEETTYPDDDNEAERERERERDEGTECNCEVCRGFRETAMP
jgi:hypothetical protein